jgi:CRP/FNR family transcriptional regulator, cyclic AMP receptor protein
LSIEAVSDTVPWRGKWPEGTVMSRLDERTGNELLALAPGISYRAGVVLTNQGSRDERVYLLEPGPKTSACVKVTACLANGAETLLGIRVGGDLVGELAAITHRTQSATAVTCSTVLAHAMTGDDFLGFLSRYPCAWEAVTLMIADRLEWANRRRLDYAGHDARVHLARVLVELVRRYGHRGAGGYELGVSLSQPELGKLIGVGQDAVGLAVRELRDAGLVRTRYRGVVVCDLPGLARAGELEP